MKKILLALLIFPLVSYASIDSKIVDKAADICGNNNECISIISVELDSSYQEGVVAKQSFTDEQKAISMKKAELADLCDKAPDAYLCDYYRNQLLRQFYKGFKS